MSGYDLQRVETQFSNKDNQDWLGSAHGVETADSITLDPASFLTAFPGGEVPSGCEVSQRADGRFGIIDLTATTGDVAAGRRRGFLLHSVAVRSGVNAVGALLWHGQVIASRVPRGAGVAAPVASTHPAISLV